MLVRVFQVRSEERDFVLTKLQKTRERCDRTLLGNAACLLHTDSIEYCVIHVLNRKRERW